MAPTLLHIVSEVKWNQSGYTVTPKAYGTVMDVFDDDEE